MSLATYDDLKSAIADWIDREDLTNRIPDFIALAEAQIARDLVRAGGVRRMVTRLSTTVDAEFEDVPADYAGTRSFKLDGYPALDEIGADEMADRKALDPTSGIPTAYSIVGGRFEFFRVPQESFAAYLTYYARPAALSDANTSNWILSQHPDAYLYGSLLQSAPYLRDVEAAQIWNSGYAAALSGIIAADATEAHGGAPTMRRRTFG